MKKRYFNMYGYTESDKDSDGIHNNEIETDRDIDRYIEARRREFYEEWLQYIGDDWD